MDRYIIIKKLKIGNDLIIWKIDRNDILKDNMDELFNLLKLNNFLFKSYYNTLHKNNGLKRIKK